MATRERALLVDLERCIGCRSCQVACKEWNELPAEPQINRGSYENPPDLNPNNYNRIRFIEQEEAKGVDWLFFSQRCLHCGDAGCVNVCPSGALFKEDDGTVGVDQKKCIGCMYCKAACPFDIPRHDAMKKVSKCHMCPTRINAGMEPACSKACPTDAIAFGPREQVVAAAEFSGKKVYGATELEGCNVVYLIPNDETPESYGLPANPAIPSSVATLTDVIRPLGWLGLFGALGAAVMHYVTIGPKNIVHDDETDNGDS